VRRLAVDKTIEVADERGLAVPEVRRCGAAAGPAFCSAAESAFWRKR